MYEQFFGLSEKPFSIQPDPSFLYWGRTHRLAYAMLEYGVLNHAGISVITGEVGCGKTTLIHRLLDQLSDTHTVALLSNVQQGRGDLLSWVLMGFGEPFAGKSHVELFAQLQNFFVSEYAKGRRVVLVIDESQNLSVDMLEELRMLSNINAGKDQLLQLILVGQPELKGLLNKPELLQLAQRIGADFHLTPLNKEEVHAYIETRLSIAGCSRRIFTERAMDFVAEQSRGVPRVINIIADTALVYAFSAEELVVGVETIRNVVRDKVEFGVFGLASDDKAAAPIKPAQESPMDAFADASGERRDKPPAKPKKSAEDSTAPEPVHSPSKPDSAPATQMSPQVNTESTLKEAPPDEKPRAPHVRQEATSPTAAPKEESAITGVVIIAAGKRSSPESAIRSAGDGRAIVFVSDAADDDARTIARKSGAVITEVAETISATSGRLRNAGYRQLKKIAPHIEYVQFLDADQALAPDWIAAGEKFLQRRPEVSMIIGDIAPQNEGIPSRSDHEEKEAHIVTGGGALVRAAAFEEIGGFRGDLITAAMQDLSIRLRRRGGRIWRSGTVMAIAEATTHGLSDWWSRYKKRGFENAYGAALHGGPAERLGVRDTIAAIGFGAVLPLVMLLVLAALLMLTPTIFSSTSLAVLIPFSIIIWGTLFLMIIVFLTLISAATKKQSFRKAFSALLGRTPEFLGACKFWFGKKTIAS